MKPAPFDYIAPTTSAEALRLLADQQREPKVLAGGQSLVPMLNMRLARPQVLVDITRIPELGALWVDDEGLHVGAAVRQAAVETAPAAQAGWPLLVEAIRQIGHPQIRNRGTVCGSLAHHDPAAELPAVAVALDARFVAAGPAGKRTIPAADFFTATFVTALEPEELLVEVIFPPMGSDGWAFTELARTHGDFATVGVAVRLARNGDHVGTACVVCCGVGSVPVRLADAEHELVGNTVNVTQTAAAGERAVAALEPPGDVHATGEYRRETAGVLVQQAIGQAWERANER